MRIKVHGKKLLLKNPRSQLRIGGRPQDLNAFLETGSELSAARNTSTKELFESAQDLFRGPALITVRALKRYVTSWEELVVELKAEFESQYYDDRLWVEIRRWRHGSEESIGVFATVMNKYFLLIRGYTTSKLCLFFKYEVFGFSPLHEFLCQNTGVAVI